MHKTENPYCDKPRKSLKLGVCPIGKFVFSHEEAVRQKNSLLVYLESKDIHFSAIDSVIPDGLVSSQTHVATVVEHFSDIGIDALFIPHCNFGTEGAAGMIAKHLDVPTLLWGPRDESPLPDGSRLRDTLCGILATSKVLYTLKVPFTYINNCCLNDPCFSNGLDMFLRAAQVAKTVRSMRIGMLGQRIDFFWSTIVNEASLLEKFGIEILPIDLSITLDEIQALAKHKHNEYQEEIHKLKSWIDASCYTSDDPIALNLAFRDRLLELALEHDLDGFSIQTFSSIPDRLGTFTSLGVAMLNDLGYPIGPESDVHGAISSIILEAASPTNGPSFLPDITIRHPSNENAVLLWHFEASTQLRQADTPVKIGRPWILKGLPPGLLNFQLKEGSITVCRFDGCDDGYRLGFGFGKTVSGPKTNEFYTWLEVDDWAQWEQQLVRGPYMHHCSCIYDDCTEVLNEACRYLPNLKPERFGHSS